MPTIGGPFPTPSLVGSLQQYQKTLSVTEALPASSPRAERFGAAVEVAFSEAALSFLSEASSSQDTASFGGFGDEDDLFNDIFDGVAEQLTFAGESGISRADQGRILQAGEAFTQQANAIFEEAGDQPLTEEQLDRLIEADNAFHSVVDSVYGPPLSDSQSALLESADQGFEQLLGQLLDNLGGETPSDQQIQVFEAAEQRFSISLEQIFSSNRDATDADRGGVNTALQQLESDLTGFFG